MSRAGRRRALPRAQFVAARHAAESSQQRSATVRRRADEGLLDAAEAAHAR